MGVRLLQHGGCDGKQGRGGGMFMSRMDGSGRCCYAAGVSLASTASSRTPLMMSAGKGECDNYYYRNYVGLFQSV